MINRTLVTFFFAGMLTILFGCDPGEKPEIKTEPVSSELRAVVSTDRGEFTILLRPELTPVAVANFVNLVESGFYHGKEVANANPASFSVGPARNTPNYTITPEYTTELLFDRPGIVAWTFIDNPEMVKNFVPHPVRFFVTKTAQSNWNLTYASFGEVVDGIDVVRATQKGDWIKSIRIVGDTKACLTTHADQVAQWNSALEKVNQNLMDQGNKGVAVPEGVGPAGF